MYSIPLTSLLRDPTPTVMAISRAATTITINSLQARLVVLTSVTYPCRSTRGCRAAPCTRHQPATLPRLAATLSRCLHIGPARSWVETTAYLVELEVPVTDTNPVPCAVEVALAVTAVLDRTIVGHETAKIRDGTRVVVR